MNAKNVIEEILKEKGRIRQVYWVACGGSLIDLYPAHFMMNAESGTVESGVLTRRGMNVLSKSRMIARCCAGVGRSLSRNDRQPQAYLWARWV